MNTVDHQGHGYARGYRYTAWLCTTLVQIVQGGGAGVTLECECLRGPVQGCSIFEGLGDRKYRCGHRLRVHPCGKGGSWGENRVLEPSMALKRLQTNLDEGAHRWTNLALTSRASPGQTLTALTE